VILSRAWLKSDNIDLKYSTSYIKVIEHGQCLSIRGDISFLLSLLDYYLTAVRMTTDLERFLQDGGILIGREKV
jgi:hypothetical protein